MSIKKTTKIDLDIRDFWRIHNGLELYAGLNTKATMERLRKHKEDALCTISPASGKGELFCTRDGYEAIFEIAERQVNSLPVPDDYSSDEVAKQIRRYIAQAIVEQKADEPTLEWVLAKALSEVEAGHLERTYHFPCVLVACTNPSKFEIGSVTFTRAEHFPVSMAEVFRRYLEREDRPDRPQQLEGFKKHLAEYGWVATITVPPCAEQRGLERAELVVSTAINLLRAFLGNHHARDIRLARAPQSKPAHSEYACEQKGELHLNFTRRAPGVLADNNWLIYLQQNRDYWKRAAHLLKAAVQGNKSEIARRLIDGLGWFGEAAFEVSPGAQVLKYVLALERLSTTEIFRPHLFCTRVGLMSAQNDTEFEQRYWDAYSVYAERSLIVHAGRSAKASGQGKNLRLAHEITRKALFRGLGIHCALDDSGKCSTLADLRKFLQNWESPRAALLLRLRGELYSRLKADRKLLFQ